VVFCDLLTRLPDIEVVGDAVRLDAAGFSLVTGVKHLNVRFTPTSRPNTSRSATVNRPHLSKVVMASGVVQE
jgi:hypothetical protein